jgi:segregation and condensation protein A
MPDKYYEVRLNDIFEGPMDLLIHLIKKNEVYIYDIPVALITDQYLEYLNWIKAMDVDFAGDFIVMASTLTQLKSKMMLPVVVEENEENEEDPREQITKPLIEYLKIKSAAEELAERSLLGEDTFVRLPTRDEIQNYEQDDIKQVGLFELIDAFQKILKTISPDHRVDFTADKISVKDKISDLVDILEEKRSITFSELFCDAPDKTDIIVTFLAILEMVKLSLIRMIQHLQTGVIRIFYV